MSTLLIFFVSGIVILLTYIINNKRKERFWKLLDDFYGRPTLPLIGNAHQMGSSSEELIKKRFALFEEAGFTSYKVQVGSTVMVVLCDPDTVEVILSSNKEITKTEDYSFVKEWLGDGLLLSSGAKWRKRRKIITPTFHFKILEQFVKVFNDNGKILVQQLANHKGKTTNIYPFINHYTLDVICETAMGVSVNAQIGTNSEYVKAVHSICKIANERITSPWKRIEWLFALSSDYRAQKKDLQILHKMTNDVIKSRREVLKDQIEKLKSGEQPKTVEDEFTGKKGRTAFLDLLLLSKLPDGSFLSDEDIREETDTFMFEGHDTTTSAISFTLHSLANDPNVQQKALDEVLSIVGSPNNEITYEHLQDMKYLDMVIKESLRLYPTVPWFGRRLQEDLELRDGKIIPSGCCVFVDTMCLGRNPRHFLNPDKFDPERFSPENAAGKSPYMSVPFSAGSRNCIGQKFAMLEAKSAISKILMSYELVAADEKIKLRLASELILKSVNGVNLIIKERIHTK